MHQQDSDGGHALGQTVDTGSRDLILANENQGKWIGQRRNAIMQLHAIPYMYGSPPDQHGANYIWGDIELFNIIEWTESKEYEPMTLQVGIYHNQLGP